MMKKGNRESHVPNTKKGMGDYYGTGIKQKVGTSRVNMLTYSSVTPQKLKNPPKSLA